MERKGGERNEGIKHGKEKVGKGMKGYSMERKRVGKGTRSERMNGDQRKGNEIGCERTGKEGKEPINEQS